MHPSTGFPPKSDMLTITEALAEIKTIGKRIATKRGFVDKHVVRMGRLPGGLKISDPLEAKGGSEKLVGEAMQAIGDLEKRILVLRRAIAEANTKTELTIGDSTRTIADWLVWRREVLPDQKRHLMALRHRITQQRGAYIQQQTQQLQQRPATDDSSPDSMTPVDITVCINEFDLLQSIERLEAVEGELDGALSLKNATTMVNLD